MMADEKLNKVCRVVVTDLRSILPPTMLAHLTVPCLQNVDDQDVEMISDGMERSRLSSPIKNGLCSAEFLEPVNNSDKVLSVSSNFLLKNNTKDASEMMAVSKVLNMNPKVRASVKTVKNLNIYKNKRSISKSNKRRGHHVNTNVHSQAKNRLLDKYGSTLLRKPLFTVEGDLRESSSQEFSSSENVCLSSQELEAVSVSETDLPVDSTLTPLSSVCEVAQESLVQEQNTCSNTSTRSSSALSAQNLDNQENEVQNSKLEKAPPLDSAPINHKLSANSEQLLSETISPMPPVGLSVNVGVGHKLPILQAKCVLTCLEKCETSLTPQFAKFSSSVVKSSSHSPLSKVLIPVDDERILQFMRIKWQSRPDLQKLPSSVPKHIPETNQEVSNENEKLLGVTPDEKVIVGIEKVPVESMCDVKKTVRRKRKSSLIPRLDDNALNVTDVTSAGYPSAENPLRKRPMLSSSTYSKEKLVTINIENTENNFPKRKRLQCVDSQNLPDSDDETRNVALKTLDNFPIPNYDPDDSRGIQCSEIPTKECKQVIRGRKSHLMHELRRLNVAVFDLPNNQESVTCRNSDICRLGCVCNSLTVTRTVRDHCGLEQCMFSCVCVKAHVNPQSTCNPSYTWMHNKAKANLAKEEKYFKQTVVRSEKDGLVLVEGRRKREIKVPTRYREDFVADVDLKTWQVKSGRTVKGVLQESQTPDRASNSLKSPKTKTTPEKVLTEKEITDAYNSSSEDDETYKSQNPEFCSRTISYDFKACKDRQEKQRQLLEDSSGDKIAASNDLKIVSIQSVNVDEWENSDNKMEKMSNLELSCSALFKPSPNREDKPVRLLSWKNLRKDIDQKKAFVWMKLVPSRPKMSTARPKIYLTSFDFAPVMNCIDVQSIDLQDPKFRDLPFHLKSLRSDYPLSDSEGRCVWIVKCIKSHWMIVGYMQPGQRKHSVCQNPDVDVLSSEGENECRRWWVMDIRQNFDLIYFMDFKKAITKDQISTLVKLSNEYSESETKVHRILLNRRRPKIDPRPTPYPDFGAYSLPSHPNKVLIGPYDFSKEPKFHVYVCCLQSGKIAYQKIPLFYSGGGEFVRINAQGVLSLHTERPPEKYVEGSWYVSSENDLRSLDALTLNSNQATDDKVEMGGLKPFEIEAECAANISEASSKMLLESNSGLATDKSNGSENDPVPALSETTEKGEEPKESHFESVSLIRVKENEMQSMVPTAKQASPETSEGSRGPNDGNAESVSVLRVREDKTDLKVPTTKKSLPELSHNRGAPKDTPVESVSYLRVRGDIMQAKVPQAQQSLLKKEVDSRIVKNMPHVSTNVSHTHTASLKSKKNLCEETSLDDDCEDVPELTTEYLVPSVRAFGVLPVTYLPTDALSVPHFTQPGLLQFFHTRGELIQEINRLIHFKLACLSQKCCVVLKSSDICRCVAWRTVWDKEKCAHLPQFSPEIFNGYFMLTKYGLLDVRTADGQTLRRLGEDWVDWLKEDELKAKLNAWEKQENEENCDFLNLSLPGVLTLANKEILNTSTDARPLYNDDRAIRLVKESLIASLTRKLNGIPGSVIPNFLELLDLDILWSSQQLMSNLNETLRVQTKTTTSQRFRVSKSIDFTPMLKSSIQKDENNTTDNQPPSPRKDVVKGRDGLACRLSPFSRLNICVEEGGIKYAPLSSPPRSSSPVEHLAESLTSPGKQPNILRRNKTVPSNKTGSSSGPLCSKQSRKQTFSISSENDEEPVFLKVPENSPTDMGLKQRIESNLSNIDHIVSRSNIKTKLLQISKPTAGSPTPDRNFSSSSAVVSLPQSRDNAPPLKISSVGSGASFWHETSEPVCPNAPVEAKHPPVSRSSSPPPLHIFSVYSKRPPSPSASSTQTEFNSCVTPKSSFKISSVSSSANSSLMQHAFRKGKSLLITRKMVKADSSVLAILKSNTADDLGQPAVKGKSDSDSTLKQQSSAEAEKIAEEETNKKLENTGTSSSVKKKLKNSHRVIKKRLQKSDSLKKCQNSESSLNKEPQNSDSSVSMELKNSESSKKKKLQGSKSLTKKKKLQNCDSSKNKKLEISDSPQTKELPNSDSSKNKKLKISDSPQTKELPNSDSSKNKKLEISDSPQTKELPNSDSSKNKKLEISDSPQTKELPNSDSSKNKKLEISDSPQTKKLPNSDSSMNKKLVISESPQTKKLPNSDSSKCKKSETSDSPQTKKLPNSDGSINKESRSSESLMIKELPSLESSMNKGSQESESPANEESQNSDSSVNKSSEGSDDKKLLMAGSPQSKKCSKAGSPQTKDLQSSESLLNKTLLNVESSAKTIKVLKRSNDSVTVAVPISALKILPPDSINKKFEANLLRWAKESLTKIERKGNGGTKRN
ncbi:S-antigen protein [Frankliniella fusca]|uniref:S-antigen protein n=1 Tax=Frankliniella fusca TaxID=407009 RepID=A0AAE1HA72_9NEOP|nr:S-antigen protein [Frankliniella fusca]